MDKLRMVVRIAALRGILLITMAFGVPPGPLFIPTALATPASDDGGRCTVSSLRGAYVFSASAFRTFQPAPQFAIGAFFPVVLIGVYTFDGAGTVARSLIVGAAGGQPFPVADSGTYQLNPNCSGSVAFPAQSETLSFNVVDSRSIVIVTSTPGESGVATLDKQEIEDCSTQDLRGTFIYKGLNGLLAVQDPSQSPPLLIDGFAPVAVGGSWTFDGKGGVSRELPVISFGGFNFGPYSDAGTYQVNSDCTASAYFPNDTEPFQMIFVNSRTIAFEVAIAGRVGIGTLVKQRL
jgi:hypothetical protein